MKLLLIDGHYYVYRSFFAIQNLSNSKGEPTNAIFGFTKTLRLMIKHLQPELGARLLTGSSPLTSRECDVLRLLALGHTNAEVAERLHLSVRTVETHRANIQSKLGSTSRADLVRHARENGLVAS